MRLVAATVSLAFLAACAPALAPVPPPVAKVAVLPAGNRTGDPLLVAGGSVIEKYAFGTPRVTVPDLLQLEAGSFLRARGVPVVEPGALAAVKSERGSDFVAALAADKFDGAALRLDVWRWEPDAGTHPAFIVVGLDAALIDVASGRTLWQARRPPRPVPTQGAVTLGAADQIAARAAVAELLDAWKTPKSRPGE